MPSDNPTAIRVVQITDTHLGHHEGDSLLSLDADMSLGLVLQHMHDERGYSDVMLATGDISNCGSIESYNRFANLTSGLAQHSLWLPGNHDLPDVMSQARGGELQKSLQVGNWLIIMLDSTARGEVGGSFTERELAYLADQLATTTAEHVLVCLHHHPVKCGCDWLDQQLVSNADSFFEILDGSDKVRAVLWGHIHQEIDRQRKGVRLLATPSSCVQFKPGSEDFKLDENSPGFRWLELYADGRIDTAVSRIDTVFELDYKSSSGY